VSGIKAILVVAIAFVAIWSLRHRENVGLRAGGRLLMVGVGLMAVLSVVFPSITQRAADAVGVARGADLVLYALIVAFAFTTASMYFRQRDLESRIATLARALAIHQAVTPEDLAATSSSTENDTAEP
jgi:hypothetical protein